jgi:hypothetical protein
MPATVEDAIAKVKAVGDKLCLTQVYSFDDYDPASGDATSLCKRLGIPVTDDIIIEFPINRTFQPLSPSKIAKLSKQLGASLPVDYNRLLTELGAFHLPGNADIGLFPPGSAFARTRQAWWFKDPLTTPVLAISSYDRYCDGDSLGFLRAGKAFAPELYVFKHELRSQGEDPQK